MTLLEVYQLAPWYFCGNHTPQLWLCTLQVSKATIYNDFDAGTVRLSAAASARPGGSRNSTLLQQAAQVDVVLTRTPGMAVSIALASGQTGIFSSPGASDCSCSWFNVWVVCRPDNSNANTCCPYWAQ